jgi:hypothetical protein
MSDEPFFYDTCETELDLSPPGDPLPVSIPSTPKVLVKHDPNFDQLRPFLGWLSTDIIKKTFEHTTQYAQLPAGTLLKTAFKSPNPALKVYCCQGDVSFDIVYSDVPAIYDGSTAAVIFVGVTLQSLMYMVLNMTINLLTYWRTTLFKVVLSMNSSVTIIKLL